jgi:hypothetical protein
LLRRRNPKYKEMPHIEKKSLLFLLSALILILFVVGGWAFLSEEQLIHMPRVPDPAPLPLPPSNTEQETVPREIDLRHPPPIADPHKKGWNIYRNEEYGFEINYPEDWRVGVSTKKGDFSDNLTSATTNTLAGFSFAPIEMCCDFLISIYITQGPLESELQRIKEGWETKQEKLRVNSLDAIRIVFNPTDVSPYYSYKVERHGLIFTFVGGIMEEGNLAKEVFEEMFESLKFIE